MSALATAAIYFGAFVAVGVIVKVAAGRWLNMRDIELSEVRRQLGPNQRRSSRFLLGMWRKEDPE